jgi:hypothetical protein
MYKRIQIRTYTNILVLFTVRNFRDLTGLKMLKKDRSRTELIATFNFRPDRIENLK